MIVLLTSGMVAALGVWMLLPVLRARVLDVPNARSSHQDPTPRAGGVAVLVGIGIAVAVAALSDRSARLPWQLLVAVALMALLGLADDVRSLAARVRLLCQLVAAGLLASLAPLDGPWFAVLGAALVVAIVGYINAFNFMDGVNGISALNAVVAGSWYAWLGHHLGAKPALVLGLALVGSALGFLPWNAPKATIFLGDCGSYGIGAAIAVSAVLVWRAGATAPQIVAPLVVYLADTGWVLIKRAAGGRPLTVAHREHVYQRLVDAAAWPHMVAAVYTAVAAAACCAATTVDDWVAWCLIAAVTMAYLASPTVLARVKRATVA